MSLSWQDSSSTTRPNPQAWHGPGRPRDCPVADPVAYSLTMPSRHRRDLARAVLRIARSAPQASVKQIAARVGCHPSTVRRHLNRRPGPGSLTDDSAGRGLPVRVIRQSSCPPPLLRRFGEYADQGVASAAIGNPSYPASRLTCKALHGPLLSRVHAVSNAACRPSILGWLAGNAPELASWIAGNDNTPPKALVRLSADNNAETRHQVAKNPNCPPRALDRLAGDHNWQVRRSVADHPQCQAATLEHFVNDREAPVRCALAGNTNTTADQLTRLASCETYGSVLTAVAGNPNCPPEVLLRLGAHHDPEVRSHARSRLREQHAATPP